MSITSRVPAPDYFGIESMSISRLKELKRSPQHYLHRLSNPKHSDAMTLGTAAHAAVLEPERFDREFAVWTSRTEAGAMSPRKGAKWDLFCAQNAGRSIITLDEEVTARAIGAAVRADATAMSYLDAGEPEVSMQWQFGPRPCKGRVDWLTRRVGPVIVGLKTARDCRHFQFGSAAAKLGYALQWAWYFDGYMTITGDKPKMVEIVVESEAPHAVATYLINDDILDYGRDEYMALLATLAQCEASGVWPGPELGEQVLTLPSWIYGPASDDLSELGLVA